MYTVNVSSYVSAFVGVPDNCFVIAPLLVVLLSCVSQFSPFGKLLDVSSVQDLYGKEGSHNVDA
jgi:hypothetical protein